MRRRTAYAGVEKRHAALQFGGGSDGGFLTAEQGKPRHSGATVRDFSPDYMEQMLAFVVQRIERRFPKPQIRVRFPARVQEAAEKSVASFVFGRECRQTVAENLHHADRVRTSLPMPAINGRTERHGLRTRFHRLWPQKDRSGAPRNGHRVSALNAPVRHIGTETLAIGLINARSLRASNGFSNPTPFWRTAEKARSVNCTGPRGAAAPGRSPSSRAAILPAAASACRPALRA